jgi:hypothetical protein
MVLRQALKDYNIGGNDNTPLGNRVYRIIGVDDGNHITVYVSGTTGRIKWTNQGSAYADHILSGT